MFNDFFFFVFFSLFIFVFSIFVILSKNPIYSILSLVLLFFNSAGLLILLGVEFLGMLFLIIYIGAIAVLFLFVVMMLNIKTVQADLLFFRYFPLILFIFFLFLISVNMNLNVLNLQMLFYNFYFNPFVFWYDNVKMLDNVFVIGYILYTYFFYLFLVSGLILLISMLGAISLTLHKRNDVKKQQIFKQIENNFEISLTWKI
jgi:NADH-quinone oxidoreductase subunit J